MTDRPRGFFARLTGLFRGMMSGWMRDREEDNPRAVYENAISERVRQYRQLKDAVAGILYMRNKLEAELADRREELARTLEDMRRAVRRGDDEAGLALIQRKQALMAEIERAENDYTGLKGEAEEAKGNLVRFREEIRSLEREKGQTLARIANASARRRIKAAIDGRGYDWPCGTFVDSPGDGLSKIMMAMETKLGEGGVTWEMPRGTDEEIAALKASYQHLTKLRDEVIEMGILPQLSDWPDVNPNL